MNATQQVILHSQSPLPNVQQNIRQGDLLFVRVMKNLGGGNYLASFAGGRFTVKSAADLIAGQTFRARVEIAGGKLLLVPQMQGANSSGTSGAISVQNFSALSDEVAAFLASMGLEADGVAQRILQFFIQSGAKINPSLMQKARRLASKYKGREAEAAEAALVLEQKGIDSEDALDEIMSLLQDSGSSREQGEGDRSKGTGDRSKGTGDREKGAAHCSLLSDFNSRRQKNSGQENCAWILLPFEFEFAENGDKAEEISDNGGKPSTGNGVLRLYLNMEKNAAQKFVINFKTSSENLFFAVYYSNKKVARLEFSAEDDAFVERLNELALSLGEGVEFCTVPFKEFSSFATENLPLSAVEGFA